ncbi:MAG: glycosyltransferase family 4 protein [bacterium]|nr:glycosyltransferase family 4 protein [Candidatus Kapabacteria bacterium]
MNTVVANSEPQARSQTAPARRRRRLLVIAYYFPPMGLSGVQRIAKIVKYLPEHGWDVTVLTVGDVGYFAHDYSLLEETLGAGVRIERTKTLDPLRLFRRKGTIKMPSDQNRRLLSGATHTFLQPDNKIGWKRFALKRARELAADEPFDAIFSTAPPFTDFLIGHELRQSLGIPLIVDYRDPWLDNRNYFFATPLHRRYATNLEKRILKSADSIVVVNRKIKEKLIARYPFLTHTSVEIIPNGFDPDDIEEASRKPIELPRKFRLTYSGHFDAGRTPEHLFKALAELFAANPAARDEVEVRFVGHFHEAFQKTATRLGVSNAVVPTGYVDHRESVRHLMASDVLWLTIFDPTITPGKIYEYMGTAKPILALAPDGALRHVLRGYGAATIVEPTDVAAITRALTDLYSKWRTGSLPRGSAEHAREFDQRRLVEQLARIIAHTPRI